MGAAEAFRHVLYLGSYAKEAQVDSRGRPASGRGRSGLYARRGVRPHRRRVCALRPHRGREADDGGRKTHRKNSVVKAKSHPVKALIGLGSNIGDRKQNILRALQALDNTKRVRLKSVSTLLETKPI